MAPPARPRLRPPAAASTRLLLALAIAAGVVAATGAAALVDTPSPAPSATPAVSVRFIDPTPPDGAFVGTNSVTLAGTKDAGRTVVVTAAVGHEHPQTVCRVDDASASAFSCPVQLPDGGVTLVATESSDEGVVGQVTRTLRVLGPPTIDGPDGALTTGLVTGLARPRARIALTVAGPVSFTQGCPGALDSGYWSCALGADRTGDGAPDPLPDGVYTVRAVQGPPDSPGDSSQPSAARTVRVDKTAPLAPAVTAPAAGATVPVGPVAYSGTGEDGATVQVFVDGTPVCTVVVRDGAWSCTSAALGAGAHRFRAFQRDVAGNFSAPSPEESLTVGAGAPPPPATRPPRATRAPSPAPTPRSETAPATPSPSPAAPGPSAGSPPFGGDAQGSTIPPDAGVNWGAPTTFGSAVPTASRLADPRSWIVAGVVAILFIALVALPLRLLVTIAGDRLRVRPPRLVGRNQAARDDFRLNPWFVAACAVAGAAALAALAGGINGEVRYVRLVLAIALGLVTLNVLGMVLPARLAGGRSVVFRLAPFFLVVGATTALLSRLGSLHPPIVVGVLVAAVLPAAADRAASARVALAQLGGVGGVALLAWAARAALGATSGFVGSAVAEALSAMVLAGAGSLAVLLLPIGSLPGRAVFAWSKPAWLAASLLATTLAAVTLATTTTFPLAIGVGAAALFALVCVCAWGWVRYVEPAT